MTETLEQELKEELMALMTRYAQRTDNPLEMLFLVQQTYLNVSVLLQAGLVKNRMVSDQDQAQQALLFLDALGVSESLAQAVADHPDVDLPQGAINALRTYMGETSVH